LRRLDDGRHGGARHGRRARRGARGAHACSGGRARVPGHRRLARRARDRGGRLRRRRHRRLRRGARAGQRPRPRRPRGARGPGGPAARRRRESGCGMTTAGGIPSPPVGTWYLGPLPIRAYAFAILAGIVVAAWISLRRYRARGGPEGVVLDAVMWAVPFGIVGARIYHVLSSPDRYFGPDGNIAYALRIWEGGLGIWGAIPAGALGAWIALRRAGVRMAPFADALAPALLVAQAIGRLGNYFNQELFGSPTTPPWGLQIDQAHLRRPGVDPPDLPLRARVEPRDGRAAGLPRPTPEAASRTRVLALRGALHAGSRVDRDAAHRRGRDGARFASERLDVDHRAAARARRVRRRR